MPSPYSNFHETPSFKILIILYYENQNPYGTILRLLFYEGVTQEPIDGITE